MKMSISDEQKRWMLVGISLNMVLAPRLRHYVENGLKNRYTLLDTRFSLKTLSFAVVHSNEDFRNLKFYNINNNASTPGNNKRIYNYSINSPVDLAKLYLPADYCAFFNNFDDSLDLSAMLKLLGTPKLFPLTHAAANEVREKVRNKWGHCNLTEWTDRFCKDCLKTLDRLVQCLGLGSEEEAQLKDKLRKSNGLEMCMEDIHDEDHLQLIQQAMRDLRQQCKNMDIEFPNLKNELERTVQGLSQMEKRVDNLEEKVKEVTREVGEMKQKMEGVTHERKARDEPPLQKEIKNEYETRHSWIHPFPWLEHFQLALEDVFTRLKVVPREKGIDSLPDETVGMFEIFEPHKDCERRPRRVLVEADPGMGKTTFSEKLCLDWATGRNMQPFPLLPLVIFLKCRDLLSDDIMEAVVDQLLPNDVSENDKIALLKFIEENQSDILLVVDGMDELGKEIDLSELIQRRILSQIHLLVTTRHEAGIKIRRYFDSLYEITGYTISAAKAYISKYFKFIKKEEKGERLLRKIDETIDEDGGAKTQDGVHLKELLSNPLRTSLLCAVSEDHGGELPSSHTMLYNDISSCILRRHFKKEQPEAELPDDPLLHYREDLLTIGKLALRGTEENRLYFDARELKGHSPNIMKFGFLSTEAAASKTRPVLKCSFLHRTFQEYLASLYLSDKLITEEVTVENLISKAAQSGDILSGFAQIFRFCAGFLAGKRATAVLAVFMKALTRVVTTSYDEGRLSFFLLCDCVCEGMIGGVLNAEQRQLCAFIGQEISWDRLVLGEQVAGETGNRWKVVCEVLKNNSKVAELYLDNNQLTDVSLLVSSLAHNTSLKVLDLRWNFITDFTGLERLVQINKKLRIGTDRFDIDRGCISYKQ